MSVRASKYEASSQRKWHDLNRCYPSAIIWVKPRRSGIFYAKSRSGRCVYGEDVEAALRFLFNAMAAKQILRRCTGSKRCDQRVEAIPGRGASIW